jgi:sterol desaturase/sphingolipid hydroxylase (fatty acid hydroxylase superfamily)
MPATELPPPRPHLSLSTSEPTAFGSGFLSGLVSAILGIAGLGAVLTLRFPATLSATELRPFYDIALVRTWVPVVLSAALLFGTVSAYLRANKTMSLVGIGCTLLAAVLGGSRVPVGGHLGEGSWLGVDFFVLNLVLYCAVFVPLERFFALRPEQPVFRREWVVDLTYFFVNALLIEVLTLLTLRPAAVLFTWARLAPVTTMVGALPLVVQVPVLLLVADFTQYWVHRAFHQVPALWRFHAIHHSAESMDWLAGSRLHVVDAVVTRGLTYLPIFILGFSQAALIPYVFIVAAQATFIHANVRWRFRLLRPLIATPAFHHWHHSAERQAIDRNFAVHTPVWDRLFGTYYLPDRWPESYGLHGGRDVPFRWITQFVHPFRGRRKSGPSTSERASAGLATFDADIDPR